LRTTSISLLLGTYLVLAHLSRYLDEETPKGPFRSSSQAASVATSLTTQR